jgi:hypothetical protein
VSGRLTTNLAEGLLAVAAMVFALPVAAATAGVHDAGKLARAVSVPPAAWSTHDVIVDLHDLPQRYSCDDLWYKFRNVLIAVGAVNLKVLPYRCEAGLGAAAYSPSVQLRFETATRVDKAAADPALRTELKQVEIGPGLQPHLDSRDCALMRQIKSLLLERYLGESVPTYHLACTSDSAPYSLTVQALIPAPAGTPAMVATADTRVMHR